MVVRGPRGTSIPAIDVAQRKRTGRRDEVSLDEVERIVI
jgi:hypothetical protein